MELSIVNAEVKNVDLKKWAEITIQKWQFNLVNKNLVYSGDLLRSFEYTVYGEANGNYALINFAFNYYFRMLEMGVHKGKPLDKSIPRKGIFTSALMAQTHRLAELVAEMYAHMGAVKVVEGFGGG